MMNTYVSGQKSNSLLLTSDDISAKTLLIITPVAVALDDGDDVGHLMWRLIAGH